MTPEGAATLSPFAGLVAMTGLCSQRLTNIRRSDPTSSEQSEFWRSGTLDSNLIRPFIIPSHLRVPSLKWDPNLYFLNMVAHASTIGVHQHAVAKAGVDSLLPDALRDSERVRVESAIEIASIMRASCHVDLSAVSLFINFPPLLATNNFSIIDKSIYILLLIRSCHCACTNEKHQA